MKKRILFFASFLLIVPVFTFTLFSRNIPPDTNAQQANAPTMTVLASNLEIPWAMAFLPNGTIIFTERPGRIKTLTTGGQVTQVGSISEVKHSGEGGLLGIATHPQFATNNFIYVYYTYGGSGNNTLNRVVRYTFTNNQISAPLIIVDAIPGASNHNGGRLKFGPDGYLYITTGDAANPSLAQDKNSLAGKILRVTDTGQPAPGNPFGNRTYTYGHRNPQGITWSGNTVYATEHGESFKDELNLIQAGKNYGWPTIEGDATQAGLESPLAHSGNNSWAPSGTAFYNGSVFFAGLRGQALFEAVPQGTTTTIKQHFKSQLGRIREAVVGPDNMLYITTSNRDGRGAPGADDDKIIRVSFGTQISPQPTFACLGSCPTAVPPTSSANPTTAVTPQPTNTIPPSSPAPTTNPCENAVVSVASHKNKHKNKGNGAVRGISNTILELLINLLNMILKLLGGQPINLPTNPGTPQPTTAPQPTVDPGQPVPTSNPTQQPTPTEEPGQPTPTISPC